MDLIKPALAGTFAGFAEVLGLIFSFGLLLFLLSRLTRHVYNRLGFSWLDIYVTGWIGTPVHEAGHALFCLLFRHRIDGIKLFSPGSAQGSLGYVNHSYSRKSIYQNIGCFFISTGPLFMGVSLIYLLMFLFLPNYHSVISAVSDSRLAAVNLFNIKDHMPFMISSGFNMIAAVFNRGNFSAWEFYLFIYLSACISSHMALSPQDLKGMWKGMLIIIIILFLINLTAVLLRYDLSPVFAQAAGYSGYMTGIFIFAAVISMLNFLLSLLLLGGFFLVKNKRI
ncbi:MAG: hypothetical protein ACM3Q2_06035 [Syntrophothermus sp.]